MNPKSLSKKIIIFLLVSGGLTSISYGNSPFVYYGSIDSENQQTQEALIVKSPSTTAPTLSVKKILVFSKSDGTQKVKSVKESTKEFDSSDFIQDTKQSGYFLLKIPKLFDIIRMNYTARKEASISDPVFAIELSIKSLGEETFYSLSEADIP